MWLKPYRPEDFGSMTAFRDRMNRLFESFFGEDDWRIAPRRVWPPVDIIETPETLQVKAEVPGIEAKDIDVSVVGNVLTIRGQKVEEKEEKGKTWHRRERSEGKFLRMIELPTDVDAEHVKAVDQAGVLTVTLPKKEGAKTRRIPVEMK